jgi:hypothetical protein
VLRVEGSGLRPLRSIDLELSPERPNFAPVDVVWCPDSRRAAVLFSYSIFHEGVVRVYDLFEARICWQRSFDLVQMGQAAWSPDGQRIAVTLLTGEPQTAYPARDVPNLLVLSAASGQTLMAVRTYDLAGPVCFAAQDEVVTAPLHFLFKSYEPGQAEKAKVWDATTGKLRREIESRGRDIHASMEFPSFTSFGDHLELSRGGKILLAYVGKEKSGFRWRAMEVMLEVADRRFEIFDYASGKPIAISPELTKSGSGCLNHLPSFRLSPNGGRVLVYWPHSQCPPSVFEVAGMQE